MVYENPLPQAGNLCNKLALFGGFTAAQLLWNHKVDLISAYLESNCFLYSTESDDQYAQCTTKVRNSLTSQQWHLILLLHGAHNVCTKCLIIHLKLKKPYQVSEIRTYCNEGELEQDFIFTKWIFSIVLKLFLLEVTKAISIHSQTFTLLI